MHRDAWVRPLLASALLLATSAVGCEPSPCADGEFPAVTGNALYVSQACGSAGGDGSLSSPFDTISAAAAAVSPGAVEAHGAAGTTWHEARRREWSDADGDA